MGDCGEGFGLALALALGAWGLDRSLCIMHKEFCIMCIKRFVIESHSF